MLVTILLCSVLVSIKAAPNAGANKHSQPPTFDEVLSGVNVQPLLADQSNEFNVPTIYHVTDGVWVAVGYGIANSIMLEGPEGLIIVDTTEDVSSAARIWQDFRRISSKPLKAVVYTHNHQDHCYGTAAFIAGMTSLPEIWAYYTLPQRSAETIRTFDRVIWGAERQFGVPLDEYLVNVGIGPFVNVPNGVYYWPIPPNKLVTSNVQTAVLAGLNVTFLYVPGETSDQMAVWLPDKKVLLPGDDIYKTFPNIYAVRGTPPRDPLDWFNSLVTMRALNAEYLVPSHTTPVSGKAEIYDLLTVYLSGIEFIHDQTTRYINRNMHPDEMAQLVKLPDAIRTHRYWRECYGRIEWAVKAVYERYLGWFSGDPVELLPYTPTERSKRYVDLLGPNRLLVEAQKAINRGDYQWGLELSSHVVRADDNNLIAKEVRLEALRNIAADQVNPPARNFYLTTALADFNLFESSTNSTALVLGAPASLLLTIMKRKVNAAAAEGIDITVGFNFTDVKQTYEIDIHWSILHINPFDPSLSYDVIVTLQLATFKQFFLHNLTIDDAVSTNVVALSGSDQTWTPVEAFEQFWSLFDYLPFNSGPE